MSKLNTKIELFVVLVILLYSLMASKIGEDDKNYSPKWQHAEQDVPPELVNLRGEEEYLESFDNPEYEHHDPSNIIKYNDLYYVWYTEHPKNTGGWDSGAYIRVATSPDGFEWTDQGIAISPGQLGSIDDKAAITAYIVPHDGKYYLFYTAFGSTDDRKGITYAVADTPDGPWEKSRKKLLWPRDDNKGWYGKHIDDTNIIFYKDKWFLYYKGKPDTPENTIVGVATSENLLGPYKHYDDNPVFKGHAFTTWVHRDGVAAFGFQTSWSEDGFNFKTVSDWTPGTVGLYCPPNFGNGKNYQGVSWGLVVAKPKGKARHINRLEIPLKIK